MIALAAGAGLVEVPEKCLPLFAPKRWKILFGGRSAAKSWSIAGALLALGASRRMLIVCGRETQNSIADSVKSLLEKRIEGLGLDRFYTSKELEILGENGTQFIFKGLRQQDIRKLKSLEGCDVLWIEEGESLTLETWRVISPTIRKPGSEIWVSFNPEFEDSPTYQRCVVNPPADAWVQKLGWQDNPWHTLESERERLDTLHRDPESYANIWEGECRSIISGAIYANELIAARNEGRVCNVPADPALPVHTFWDLGVGDQTVIVAAQAAGSEIRIVNFCENDGEGLPYYAEILNFWRDNLGYNFGRHWAPHDIQVREFGSGRSRIETARQLGIRFSMVPRAGSGAAEAVEERIHAARMVFPRCWFDSVTTKPMLKNLGQYRRAFNSNLDEFKPQPVHDRASHTGDAFGHLAVSLRPDFEAPAYIPPPSMGVGGWMG
jgi:phage terminase large subunit